MSAPALASASAHPSTVSLPASPSLTGDTLNRYAVAYRASTMFAVYAGDHIVWAEDEDDAECQALRDLRRTAPDAYITIVGVEETRK